MQIPASARHQQRVSPGVVRRIELRLRGRKQRTHDLGLIVVDRLVQRRIAFGIAAVRRAGSVLAQPGHHLRQPVCRGVVQRAVSRPVRGPGVGSAVDQPQCGIRTVSFSTSRISGVQPSRSAASGSAPGVEKAGQDLAVPFRAAVWRGVSPRLFAGRGVGSPFPAAARPDPGIPRGRRNGAPYCPRHRAGRGRCLPVRGGFFTMFFCPLRQAFRKVWKLSIALISDVFQQKLYKRLVVAAHGNVHRRTPFIVGRRDVGPSEVEEHFGRLPCRRMRVAPRPHSVARCAPRCRRRRGRHRPPATAPASPIDTARRCADPADASGPCAPAHRGHSPRPFVSAGAARSRWPVRNHRVDTPA